MLNVSNKKIKIVNLNDLNFLMLKNIKFLMKKNFQTHIFFLLFITLLLQACGPGKYVRREFTYAKSVDTHSKKIDFQTKKLYRAGNIFADNRFDGARLNDFKQLNDSTFQVLITPENTPINPSPWYAFKIWSLRPDTIYLQLKYRHAKHRYWPKISHNRKDWAKIDHFIYNQDSTAIRFKLPVGKEAQWVAAQPVINSTDTKKWLDSLTARPFVSPVRVIGHSVKGKPLYMVKIGQGATGDKKIIVLLSRQHPPEVTGFTALKYFVNELVRNDTLTRAFYQKYEVWLFPLLNPDGVDLGHWRHNAAGIDLNRDWANYRQPEIDAVTKFIVNEAKKYHVQPVLGIDFHSTFRDVYYIFDDSFHSVLPGFCEVWTAGIDRIAAPFKTRKSPFGMAQPISKNWFYKQFKAEAITYEVGDDTPDNIIKLKARAAAVTMMDLLLRY